MANYTINLATLDAMYPDLSFPGHLGHTRPVAEDCEVSIERILDAMGPHFALLALDKLTVEDRASIRRLACDLVQPVLRFTKSPVPTETIKVARAYGLGQASKASLEVARSRAQDTSMAAGRRKNGATTLSVASAARLAAETDEDLRLRGIAVMVAQAAEFAGVDKGDHLIEQGDILRAWLLAGERESRAPLVAALSDRRLLGQDPWAGSLERSAAQYSDRRPSPPPDATEQDRAAGYEDATRALLGDLFD